MAKYKIRNWLRFQHFKDRRPPWIKLYRELLDDIDWHELDAESSKILVMLWLIASEDGGCISCDTKKLSFRLRISESKLKQSLTKLQNWLIQVDINLISGGYQSDAPETETETETETDSMSGKPDVMKLNGHRKEALEALQFLNIKAKRNYRGTEVNIKLIVSRFNEGYSLQDCKSVIAKKCREWLPDDKMREYLRPATLFNREKFNQYIGEIVEVQDE